MKHTKSKDIRDLSTNEIVSQIKKNETDLVTMSFKKTLGQLESHATIRTVRRDMARMKTILRERELQK